MPNIQEHYISDGKRKARRAITVFDKGGDPGQRDEATSAICTTLERLGADDTLWTALDAALEDAEQHRDEIDGILHDVDRFIVAFELVLTLSGEDPEEIQDTIDGLRAAMPEYGPVPEIEQGELVELRQSVAIAHDAWCPDPTLWDRLAQAGVFVQRATPFVRAAGAATGLVAGVVTLANPPAAAAAGGTVAVLAVIKGAGGLLRDLLNGAVDALHGH